MPSGDRSAAPRSRSKNGTYPRSKALPNLQTFEEFYATVHAGKTLSGNMAYEALRAISNPQLAMFRVALMPPKTSDESLSIMRSAFAAMWKNPQFLADYSGIIKTEPILVSDNDGHEVLTELGTVRREIKDFLTDYIGRMTTK